MFSNICSGLWVPIDALHQLLCAVAANHLQLPLFSHLIRMHFITDWEKSNSGKTSPFASVSGGDLHIAVFASETSFHLWIDPRLEFYLRLHLALIFPFAIHSLISRHPNSHVKLCVMETQYEEAFSSSIPNSHKCFMLVV